MDCRGIVAHASEVPLTPRRRPVLRFGVWLLKPELQNCLRSAFKLIRTYTSEITQKKARKSAVYVKSLGLGLEVCGLALLGTRLPSRIFASLIYKCSF